MTETIHVGDRVKIFLDSKSWKSAGWFEGKVIRIEAYSQRRNFYWVELDTLVETTAGGRTRLVSVLNPKNIQKA